MNQRNPHRAVAAATVIATAAALYLTVARAGAPEPLALLGTPPEMISMTTSTSLIRDQELSRGMAAMAHGLPRRWQDTLGEWMSALLRPRGHELSQLDDHALRDIGLARSEIASVEAELSGFAPATRRAVIRTLERW